MGQKVNPIGFRLGVNRTWDSRWFADGEDYGRLLHQDIKLRKQLKQRLGQAGVSRIIIERPHKKCRITIYAARPGVIIGKKGGDIDKLRKDLSLVAEGEVFLNIVEVRKPETDAQLVGRDSGYAQIRLGSGELRMVLDSCLATVERLEYDPNRTAFIALIKYTDGVLSYILAPQRLKAGDTVVTGEKVDVKPGNTMPLRSMPVGTIIHNVELKPGKGGQMARSAGAYAQLVGRDAGYAQIRLGSGELRMVLDSCLATVGAVSNQDHMNENLGKAGRVRHMGRRPHVRGVAMNPVDHPHGGGEGKTSGGRHPVTPWGKPTKGRKTRTNKTTDKFIIRTRHVKKAR